MPRTRIDRVFVYGTLMPGDVRWHHLEPFADPAIAPGQDSVDGLLWSTPWGWPAMTDGDGIVHGVVVRLASDRVGDALTELDAVEGAANDLFERIAVTTHGGKECWIYRWPGGTDGFDQMADGRW